MNRAPHSARLTSCLDRYTSLAPALRSPSVVTRASPRRTLCGIQIANSPATASATARSSLTTSTGFSPRWAQLFFCMFLRPSRSGVSGILATELPTELWECPLSESPLAARLSPNGAKSHSGRQQPQRSFTSCMPTGRTHYFSESIRWTCGDLQHGARLPIDYIAAEDHGRLTSLSKCRSMVAALFSPWSRSDR